MFIKLRNTWSVRCTNNTLKNRIKSHVLVGLQDVLEMATFSNNAPFSATFQLPEMCASMWKISRLVGLSLCSNLLSWIYGNGRLALHKLPFLLFQESFNNKLYIFIFQHFRTENQSKSPAKHRTEKGIILKFQNRETNRNASGKARIQKLKSAENRFRVQIQLKIGLISSRFCNENVVIWLASRTFWFVTSAISHVSPYQHRDNDDEHPESIPRTTIRRQLDSLFIRQICIRNQISLRVFWHISCN